MTDLYFIIEHPTRGTLKEFDSDVEAGARFSWSGARNDPETAHRFHSAELAIRSLEKISPKVRGWCKVLRSTDWDWVYNAGGGLQNPRFVKRFHCPECGGTNIRGSGLVEYSGQVDTQGMFEGELVFDEADARRWPPTNYECRNCGHEWERET